MSDGQMPLEFFALIALTIAAAVSSALSYFNSRRATVQSRLKAITQPPKQTQAASVIADDTPKQFFHRMLVALGRSQGEKEKNKTDRGKLPMTLHHAGFHRPNAVHVVLGVRIVLMFALPAMVVPLLFSRGANVSPAAVLFVGALLVMGYILPTFMVQRLATKRKALIGNTLPDTLDLLVLCVESGLGLNAAIGRVADDRAANKKDPLGEEFRTLASELQVGVPRRDALRNLADRTGQEDLRPLVAHLIQTERLGGSIAPALRAQSDSARQGRKLRAEEIANRMPIKMLLPTVLFMPPLFIVIFVPVVLQAMESLKGG